MPRSELSAAVVVAIVLLLCGVALVLAGVYLLAGLGWALIAGGVPLAGCGGIIMRGVGRVRT